MNHSDTTIRGDDTTRVLLVEDNPGDVRLVREMLRDISGGVYWLAHAERFRDALALLNEQPFDVVLLDLSLPDGQGLNTLERMLKAAPSLPIVVLSGSQDEAIAVEAVRAGAQDYLVKGHGDGQLLRRVLRYAIERKRGEERLAYLAQYDVLTGLPNRALFRDRLIQAIEHAKRNRQLAALMYMDLDHFKEINDSLGHDGGDALLRSVAARLRACVRREDTVARLGGDEFVIVLSGLDSPEDAERVAGEVIRAVNGTHCLNGDDIPVTISVGVALYPKCGQDADALIKNADTALYAAKNSGRSHFRFYDPHMSLDAAERKALLRHLADAVQRSTFMVDYRPRIRVDDGVIVGVEALLKWWHPELGVLQSHNFVRLLEDSGLVVFASEWLIRTACQDLAQLQQTAGCSLRVSVPVSSLLFRNREMVDIVEDVLVRSGVDPQCLQLEVTEEALAEPSGSFVSVARALRTHGVRVCLRNFGAGRSSLSDLRGAPLDGIGVDASFVRDIARHSRDAAVLAALIALGHGHGMEVSAEGVDSSAQLDMLAMHRCDVAQGKAIGPAMSVADCEEWLVHQGKRVRRSATDHSVAG